MITPEQKEQFLDLTRRGWNRSDAAREVGCTGSMFRNICGEDNRNYDADFAAAYTLAVAEAEPDGTAPAYGESKLPPVRITNDRGHVKAEYITDEEKERFLELVAGGEKRFHAARAIGTSNHQIERLVRRDHDFAQKLSEATATGYPQYQEWLRAMPVDFIRNGNYTALRDQILIHLPEASALRTSRHEIGGLDGGALKLFVERVVPELPPQLVEQMIQHLEQQRTQRVDIHAWVVSHAL